MVENCGQCRDVFLARPALQAEVQHEAVKAGEAAATSLLRERLEGEHEQHVTRR